MVCSKLVRSSVLFDCCSYIVKKKATSLGLTSFEVKYSPSQCTRHLYTHGSFFVCSSPATWVTTVATRITYDTAPYSCFTTLGSSKNNKLAWREWCESLEQYFLANRSRTIPCREQRSYLRWEWQPEKAKELSLCESRSFTTICTEDPS